MTERIDRSPAALVLGHITAVSAENGFSATAITNQDRHGSPTKRIDWPNQSRVRSRSAVSKSLGKQAHGKQT
jgi:hypothetical protein